MSAQVIWLDVMFCIEELRTDQKPGNAGGSRYPHPHHNHTQAYTVDLLILATLLLVAEYAMCTPQEL